MAERILLAGDVGGTHARMSVFATDADGRLAERWSRTFDSASHDGLEEIAVSAVRDAGLKPAAAAFGVAGPVIDGRCRTTNLPWVIDERTLAPALGLARAALLNDLEATALGLAELPRESFALLHAGAADAGGTQALIAAGTGLGEAFLAWDGERHVVGSSEGGHASFAPLDEDEDALLAHLRGVLGGHVSWERVVSGPGLVGIARFLGATGRAPLSEELEGALERDDASAVTAAAESGDAAATRALGLFVRAYGAEAGNLALKVLATGGVFVGGGIAPKIRSWIEGGGFMERFLGKGRMRPLLERMPVRLVLDDRAALLGAARHAAGGKRGQTPFPARSGAK